MRVAELTGVRQFRLADRPVSDPGPGEIQVRVQAVGICGSDMHSYSEGAVGDTPCVYPMVIGHEPAGVVVKSGAGVTGWTAGMLAAFEPALYCYHCEFCMAGRHNVCANLRFLSTPEEPGFFREYVNLPERNLLPLPPGLSACEGTLIEPLAVVLHSMQFAAVKPGESAVVFGAGPIGLLTVAVLKLSGASRIWVVEPVPHRIEMAKAIGADAVIDPSAVDPGPQVLSDTGGRGADVIFDCAAKGNTANQCLQAARNAGRIVFTGIPSEVQVPIDFHPWRRKELALYQVRRSNHESELARDLLATHSRRFSPIVTHERPLDEIGRAFEQLDQGYLDGACKIVVRL